MGAGQDLGRSAAKVLGYHVETLDEPAECAQCAWKLEHGDVALRVGDQVFCKERCYRKALGAAFDVHVDLGGES